MGGIGCRLFAAAGPRASGGVFNTFVFLAMPLLPQVACQNFAVMPGNKAIMHFKAN
jgi:hypothetical protein